MDPLTNAVAHRFALPIVLRVADEDPNLLQIAFKLHALTTAMPEPIQTASEHSAEFMGEVRRKAEGPIRIGRIPAVPAQSLLLEIQVQRSAIHRHREEPGRESLRVRGACDIADVAGPRGIIDQRCVRQRNDRVNSAVFQSIDKGVRVPGAVLLRSRMLTPRSAVTNR